MNIPIMIKRCDFKDCDIEEPGSQIQTCTICQLDFCHQHSGKICEFLICSQCRARIKNMLEALHGQFGILLAIESLTNAIRRNDENSKDQD